MYSPLRFIPCILSKRPIHLTLFVTKRCNARCSFCFYSADEVSKDEMSLNEYRQLSSSMGDLLWLALSGGEPLLRDDLVDIVKVFYEGNRPSIILLPTNGLLPERTYDVVKQILVQCPNSTVAVKLSLDGSEALHNTLRGVEGAYAKVHQTHELLRPLLKEHKNFELGINTVFCLDNQHEMDAIIDHVLTMPDIGTHTISLARGDMRIKSDDTVDLDKYLAASKRLADGLRTGGQPSYRFKGARIKAAQDVLQRKLIHKTAAKDKQQLTCYAGRLNLVVTENAGLYPCESFKDEHYLGNLRAHEFDVTRMLMDKRSRKIIAKIGRDCYCTHECYMMTNILFNPSLYPELAWQWVSI